MCRWMLAELGPDIPLHFSRFHPQYLMKNLPPTPLSTLEMAHEIAKAQGLNYAYIGNVPGHEAENSFCPNCKNKIVERRGYVIQAVKIDKGRCRFCGNAIPGVWV
jgi:pyruvate formate lyase activating enzyme